MGQVISRLDDVDPGGHGVNGLGWAAAVAFALAMALPAGELHAQSAGQAVAVSGSVSASGPQGVRTLAAGSPVYMGDTIDTGVFGEAQIVFSDETRLAIGPGSQMVLDSYVLQTRSTTSSFVVNAARGAFRFISGGSRSNAYQVNTPTATIGIRGTAFDFSDRTRRRTNTLLYDGRITACNVAGSCVNLDRSCEVAVIAAGQPARRSDSGELVPTTIRYQFPYLVDEGRLLPEFQVQAGRCLGNGGGQAVRIGGGDGGRDVAAPPGDPGNGDQGDSEGNGDSGGEGNGDTGPG
jgi:hypothetical protein